MPSTLEKTSWFVTHFCPKPMLSFAGTPNLARSSVQASNETHTKFVPVPSFFTCSK